MELSNKVLLSKAKLNHVNTNAARVYSFVEKVKKVNMWLRSPLIPMFCLTEIPQFEFSLVKD